MSGSVNEKNMAALRNRSKPIKKWLRSEEIVLINYLKQNRNFEKPISRVYYTKFLDSTGIDADWNHVRSKVRNMRSAYRRAKEFNLNKRYYNDLDAIAARSEMLKICWHVDDFDEIFPNDVDNYLNKNPSVFDLDDEYSTLNSFPKNKTSNVRNNEKLLLEDELSSSSSSSKSNNILAVQSNMFNFNPQKHHKDTSLKQQELELAREQLNFEKEKFYKEFKLREKEMETQEKLKLMELQMKERIAMKELEIKEKSVLKAVGKEENSYNNVYHNLD